MKVYYNFIVFEILLNLQKSHHYVLSMTFLPLILLHGQSQSCRLKKLRGELLWQESAPLPEHAGPRVGEAVEGLRERPHLPELGHVDRVGYHVDVTGLRLYGRVVSPILLRHLVGNSIDFK